MYVRQVMACPKKVGFAYIEKLKMIGFGMKNLLQEDKPGLICY